MGKLFGTDGIRGEANRFPMDAPTVLSVGQAIAQARKDKDGPGPVIIGRDTRISGPMLQSALIAGITSMGCDTLLAGILPTPGVAFLTKSLALGMGIMISASHNPFQDNGIKFFKGDGFKLSEQEEEHLEDLILNDTPKQAFVPPPEIGRQIEMRDSQDRYIDFLKRSFPAGYSMDNIKVVLDTANGATHRVAPEVFVELGARTEVIHNQPNGININDQCGSLHTGDLETRVVQTGASLGLAFDGDGDRLIAVDERGRRVTGDQTLIICANALKKLGKLKNNLVIGTVMSNLGLRIACGKLGLNYHPSNVGDRYVLEDMKRLGAVIGGEESGHIIFLNHHTTGDGILSALQLIAAMLFENKPLSELVDIMEIYPQALINVPVKRKEELSSFPRVSRTIREAEKKLGDRGRVLVRYSGTQDLCRIMVEAPTQDMAEDLCARIAETIKTSLG